MRNTIKTLFEKRIESDRKALANIETQMLALEGADMNMKVFGAMQTAITAFKQVNTKIDMDKVDDVRDDLEDAHDMQNEISEALGGAIGGDPDLASRIAKHCIMLEAERQRQASEAASEGKAGAPGGVGVFVGGGGGVGVGVGGGGGDIPRVSTSHSIAAAVQIVQSTMNRIDSRMHVLTNKGQAAQKEAVKRKTAGDKTGKLSCLVSIMPCGVQLWSELGGSPARYTCMPLSFFV
jgi:hypothetical protein